MPVKMRLNKRRGYTPHIVVVCDQCDKLIENAEESVYLAEDHDGEPGEIIDLWLLHDSCKTAFGQTEWGQPRSYGYAHRLDSLPLELEFSLQINHQRVYDKILEPIPESRAERASAAVAQIVAEGNQMPEPEARVFLVDAGRELIRTAYEREDHEASLKRAQRNAQRKQKRHERRLEVKAEIATRLGVEPDQIH